MSRISSSPTVLSTSCCRRPVWVAATWLALVLGVCSLPACFLRPGEAEGPGVQAGDSRLDSRLRQAEDQAAEEGPGAAASWLAEQAAKLPKAQQAGG